MSHLKKDKSTLQASLALANDTNRVSTRDEPKVSGVGIVEEPVTGVVPLGVPLGLKETFGPARAGAGLERVERASGVGVRVKGEALGEQMSMTQSIITCLQRFSSRVEV
mmetsp:Transcript_18579/g.17901  ORF Transcript_18579/g.17901 Transcript_18579/m.17901 type:complete len:109 (-) Transcript_18579:2551-2877(-)